jgi:hypothetical protein
MPGRIGKTYPRVPLAEPARGVASSEGGRRYGVIGGLIALLSALGVLGWLFFR